MIQRLRLRNWRSYEDLDLQLDPGTTFVVAPNGVGKTSLVYGLAWGVFGEHSLIDPRNCIRAGAEKAEVQVEMGLPGGRCLSIKRSARRRGAPVATYEMQGDRQSESSARSLMEQAFGLELSVAGRLSTMLGGGHIAASDILDLESHLHHAFGVAHLLSAAETAQSVAKDAEKARASLRSATKKRIGDRAALESEVAELEAEVTRLKRHGDQLVRARDTAASQRAAVERHFALEREFERYQQQRSQLVTRIQSRLGRAASSDSNDGMTSRLRAELERSEHAIVEVTERAVTARSNVTASEQALRLLDGDEVICPTCRRPLPHRDRDSAISAHSKRQEDAEAEVRRLEQDRRARQTQAQEVSRMLAQLEALQPPTAHAEDADVPTRATAEAQYEQASADLDEHHRRLGGVTARLNVLRDQVDTDDQVRQEERDLRLAYRREAAALAGANVLRATADRMIESRIEPLANELRGRWRHLFTNNGLVFRPDGSITRYRDGQELGWGTLSGGERTWARIVTHLIVMSATTSLPFAWFDEPLEHLDPQLRHAVAATLATATHGGPPRQLLVTTYEHAIAQQLANDTEGAGIIAIRHSGN